MIGNAKRVYALAGFSVEVRPRGLFYRKTYAEDGFGIGREGERS